MGNATVRTSTNKISGIKLKGSNIKYDLSDDNAREAIESIQISLNNNYDAPSAAEGLGLDDSTPQSGDSFQTAINKLNNAIAADETVINSGLTGLDDRIDNIEDVIASKANATHTHTKSQITDLGTIGTAASKNVPNSGDASSSQVVMGNDSRLSDSRDPNNHASNKVTSLTGYKKPSSTSAILTSDSLNVALGKLEKALDDKLDSGNYALSDHTHTASEVGAIASTSKGAANGVAELDSSGKVPASQLPSYVDDVIDLLSVTTAPSTCSTGDLYYNSTSKKIFTAIGTNTWGTTGTTPEKGKIYVNTATDKTYRWSGSTMSIISESLALGETSSTAYRGDRGKEAYDHSQSAHARTDATKVESSSTNGNIKINGTETTVYTHTAPTTAEVKSALGTGSGTSKYLREDGTWQTPAGNNVIQTISSTENGDYRVLMSESADDTTKTEGTRKDTDFKYNPSTNTLSVKNISGNIFNNLIIGTGTASKDNGSSSQNRYVPVKWTFDHGRDSIDGDIITIKIPIAGHSWGVWLSIDNGTTYHPIALNGTTRLTTQFPVNTYLQLVYESNSTVNSVYALEGSTTASNVTGIWRVINYYDSNSNTIPQAYCGTGANKQDKACDCTNYNLLDKSYVMVLMVYANTSATALTLNINGKGAKAIYINGTASSATNYTLPAGSYITYYENDIYYFRTDGKITGNITGDAATVNGKTVLSNVPANAVFTDSTVNSVDNHYAPVTNSQSEITAEIEGTAGTFNTNTEYTVLTGVKAQRDAKGHITGLTYTAQKVKDTKNTGTVTSIVASTGLNGGTITTAGTISVKYGNTAETACEGNDSRLSDTRDPNDHASNKVTALTGYSKPSSTSALATTDSLNEALGKLEKALDGKQASGSYAASTHSHANYAATSHSHSEYITSLNHSHANYAASNHTHGNITNDGVLQTNDISIANGDKLVVTDSSDSNKVARTSISFDGSTTTKALTQKGTFEMFATTSHAHSEYITSLGHSHSEYITSLNHSHANYAATSHSHSEYITSLNHSHANYAASTHSHANYAATSHSHSEYITSLNHSHTNYAASNHSHTAYDVGAIASTLKGAVNGVAELDSSGKVPASQLPSFVDDVIDLLDVTGTAPSTCTTGNKYYNTSSNKIFTATATNTWGNTGETPESGKIYVNTSNSKTYRWSGTTLAIISETLALGETSDTAYRGDRGKEAYDHSQSAHARTDATKVEASTTNGKIKINGTETTVYTLPASDPYTTPRTPSNHSHSEYITSLNHSHAEYITSLNHSHANYAASAHSHSEYITSLNHSHTEYITSLNHSHANYAASVHSHSEYITSLNHSHANYAASSHTHGNITNDGTLQTNDITIANGDKLVVTDSSDSNKVARTSISFDGSTTTKALTQKGTFETFATTNHSHTTYAATNHSHTTYAATNHSHTNYAATNHSHTNYAASTHSHEYQEITYNTSTTTNNNAYSGAITIDGTKSLHVIALTGVVTSVTFATNKLPAIGHSCHIIFTSESGTTVSIAHSTTGTIRYICPAGESPDDLEIPAGGYAEINLLRGPNVSNNTMIYVRGI